MLSRKRSAREFQIEIDGRKRSRPACAGCKSCNGLAREYKGIKDSVFFKRTLKVGYWKRTAECSRKKKDHMKMVEFDRDISMEDWVLDTTLRGCSHAVEKNPFPYDTPENVEHWTLWALHDMDKREIERFVFDYIGKHLPDVEEWEYDENSHRSIDIFHVHLFLKFKSGSQRREYQTPPRQDDKESQAGEATYSENVQKELEKLGMALTNDVWCDNRGRRSASDIHPVSPYCAGNV